MTYLIGKGDDVLVVVQLISPMTVRPT